MELTTEQAAAVDLVAASPAPFLACLTGGPGTGKTTTLRAILDAARARGTRVACAAPSGKAAQRMNETTAGAAQASTLHRLLGLRPDAREWAPVEADVLVVDEASMVDTRLMAATLAAAQAGRVRTVLLVGDSDQLPPVGPGQPFHDLLHGGRCPVVRLTQVHRQAQESGIVRAAYAIVRGQEPELDAPDFRLVPCEELAEVPGAVWETITREGLDPDRSQVLCPQRTTAGGTESINAHVEESRRPLARGEVLVRKDFREGTKVINIKNDYDLGIFNGELGEVVEARAGAKANQDELRVLFAERDEPTLLRGAAIKLLRPAWALTVHKSQGSQWDDVIVVAHTGHSYMLTRRLLYVAVTRAARRVWIVGQRQAVARAVRNVRDAKRETWIGRRFARDREAALAAAGGE